MVHICISFLFNILFGLLLFVQLLVLLQMPSGAACSGSLELPLADKEGSSPAVSVVFECFIQYLILSVLCEFLVTRCTVHPSPEFVVPNLSFARALFLRNGNASEAVRICDLLSLPRALDCGLVFLYLGRSSDRAFLNDFSNVSEVVQ